MTSDALCAAVKAEAEGGGAEGGRGDGVGLLLLLGAGAREFMFLREFGGQKGAQGAPAVHTEGKGAQGLLGWPRAGGGGGYRPLSRRPLDAERVVCVSDAAYSDAEEMAAVLGLAGGAAEGDRVEPLVIDANVTVPPWVDVRCVSVVHMYVCLYVCLYVCMNE